MEESAHDASVLVSAATLGGLVFENINSFPSALLKQVVGELTGQFDAVLFQDCGHTTSQHGGSSHGGKYLRAPPSE